MFGTKISHFITIGLASALAEIAQAMQAKSSSCSDLLKSSNNGNIIFATNSSIPISTAATYDVKFINKWSATDHPRSYPGSAHWSPPIIVSHSKDYQMWSEQTLATSGVKTVAEIGATGDIVGEFKTAGDDIGDYKIGSVQFNSQMNSQVIKNVGLDKTHPHVSSISMIAPSPDWFSGFHDVVPVTCDGFWFESFTVVTQPYDAGTDSGTSYGSSNSITSPQEPIFELTASTVPSTMVFLNSAGNDVLPVLEFEFTLTTLPDQTGNCNQHTKRGACNRDNSNCCKWRKGICSKKRKCKGSNKQCEKYRKEKKCVRKKSECCKWKNGECLGKSKC